MRPPWRWLSFPEPSLEAAYRQYVDRHRALGKLDKSLAFLQALAIGIGMLRLVLAGQLLSELPTVSLLCSFGIALVWLHIRRPGGGATAAAALRPQLHLVSHSATILQFVRVAVLPKMAACKDGRPMLELMAMFLATTASYPMLAAIPFGMALPLQLILAGELLHVSPTLCELGLTTCHAAEPFYVSLAEALSHMALILPVAPQQPSLSPNEACRAIMMFMVAVLFVGVHILTSVPMERRTRAAFAAEQGRPILAARLAKKPSPLRMAGLAMVFCVFFWRLAEFWYSTPWLFSEYFLRLFW